MIPLEYHDTGYAVFALAGDLEVRMPVSRYETVGFHESGHDGAFQLEVVDLDDWTTLASRGRGTGSRTAADIVTRVDEPVMAPIDGTVIRAGSYTLYCDHTDNFVVIEPSGRPGWELKIFHFSGLQVGVGDEVIASDTMIGTGGRILPFVSQVDEFTAEPSNPHVHLEVIDTSIPDRPSSGGGC
jgi:murein DD-endopeptidase MepM/ murein hydrolase activator NlpD